MAHDQKISLVHSLAHPPRGLGGINVKRNARLIGLFSVALLAEGGASLWLLLRSPFDGPLESYYFSLFDYERGRALWWISFVALIVLIYALLQRRLRSLADKQALPNSSFLALLTGTLAIGLIVETLTSICFWKSPSSKGVRAMYESVWYWERVPRQSDYGWPSFRGYFLDHVIPWAVIFGIGLLVWFIGTRHGEKRAPDNPI